MLKSLLCIALHSAKNSMLDFHIHKMKSRQAWSFLSLYSKPPVSGWSFFLWQTDLWELLILCCCFCKILVVFWVFQRTDFPEIFIYQCCLLLPIFKLLNWWNIQYCAPTRSVKEGYFEIVDFQRCTANSRRRFAPWKFVQKECKHLLLWLLLWVKIG